MKSFKQVLEESLVSAFYTSNIEAGEQDRKEKFKEYLKGMHEKGLISKEQLGRLLGPK